MATSSAANFLAELWESIPRGWPRVVVVGVPLALPVALLDAIDKGAVASWAFASIVWLVGIGTYVLRQRSQGKR